MPVLRGCPQLDGPFQRDGKGCWFVRLRSKSKQHDTGCEFERQDVHTTASLSPPPVKIVHVGVGE